MATLTKLERELLRANALDQLENYEIVKGETIYCTTEYVGRSGTAYVRAFIMRDNEPVNITWHIGHVTRQTLTERGGHWVIRTGGGGYSRSQHVVDALGWTLFNESLALKDKAL